MCRPPALSDAPESGRCWTASSPAQSEPGTSGSSGGATPRKPARLPGGKGRTTRIADPATRGFLLQRKWQKLREPDRVGTTMANARKAKWDRVGCRGMFFDEWIDRSIDRSIYPELVLDNDMDPYTTKRPQKHRPIGLRTQESPPRTRGLSAGAPQSTAAVCRNTRSIVLLPSSGSAFHAGGFDYM